MFPFAAFNEFVAFYVFVPRKKDRALAMAGVAAALVNLVAALVLAPRFGAIGMASARVIGEVALSAFLLSVLVRLELVGLLPGAERALARVRVVCGLRPQTGGAKDD
jgi:PST family polysaccharide transporter